MKKGIIVVLGLAALLVVWGVSIYNSLVSKQETVEKAVGNVQTAYQQRADLIPNLVATVKNYAEYEASTLEAVVAARAKATSTTLDANNLTEENLKAFQAAQDQMSSALSRRREISRPESQPKLPRPSVATRKLRKQHRQRKTRVQRNRENL